MWLDLLRVVAAFAVVVLHAAADLVVFIPDKDSALWHAANVLDSLSRWCIGVFIMVSGALLLDPTRQESLGAFFGKRARRLLVPTLVWSLAYFGFAILLGKPMSVDRALGLLWIGRPWYHMWYLFMTIGLYAVTPILRFHVARSGVALRWAVALGALAAASAWDLRLSMEGQPLPRIVPTMFIPYLGYYLVGYELRRLAPSSVHPALLWGAVAVGSIATIVGTLALVRTYDVTRLGLYMYEYLSPNVILTAMAIFCLASKSGASPAHEDRGQATVGRFVTWAAPLTLGVYLVHPMVIRGMQALGVSAVGTGGVFGVLIVAIPAFCASLVLVWGMSRVPLLRRGVGL